MTDASAELIARATSGDALAVEELLERHLPLLRGYLARNASQRVLDRESVTDLAQSVCREVLERLRDRRLVFQGEAQFRQWLYRAAIMKMMARNRFWTAERREAGREMAVRPASGAPSVDEPPAPVCTPSEDAAMHEELGRFENAFASLPTDSREIILLHHVEGLAHAEIATRRGITESHSRTLLARALARLATLGVGPGRPGRDGDAP